MKIFYDIEVLKGYNINVVETKEVTMSLYEFLRQQYSPNDSYFLYNVKKRDLGNLGNDFFCTVLMMFYSKFGGDKAVWLNRTLDIVVSFDDFHANSWLDYELRRYIKREKDSYYKHEYEEGPNLMKMVNDPDILKFIWTKLEFKEIIKESKWVGVLLASSVKVNKVRSLAGLMFAMDRRNLFNNDYYLKEYHIAFNNYFNIKTSDKYFRSEHKGSLIKDFETTFNFF